MSRLKKAATTLTLILLIATGSNAAGRRLHPEAWYQAKFCNAENGRMEWTTPDGARCDCLTERYAIEFDFDTKWAEAVGQSLLYGAASNRQPGIVLIVRNGEGMVYQERLAKVIATYKLPLALWIMDAKTGAYQRIGGQS